MKQSIILQQLILSIAICWFPSVTNGMPTLTAADGHQDGHRSDASGHRLRRQMNYSEDETVVIEAPSDVYVSTDELSAAEGNLTLRFGYGGYQPPQQYNPYGGYPYGGGQPFPGYQQPQPTPNYYNNGYPGGGYPGGGYPGGGYPGGGYPGGGYPGGGYPGGSPYGPFNYNYPDYNNNNNSTTTMNPFYNNNNNYGFNYNYPVINTTTTSTTTTARPTNSTTTTRPPGNYYIFNFRDASNQTDIDDGTYNGGADPDNDDGFKFGNR